MMSKQRRLK